MDVTCYHLTAQGTMGKLQMKHHSSAMSRNMDTIKKMAQTLHRTFIYHKNYSVTHTDIKL